MRRLAAGSLAMVCLVATMAGASADVSNAHYYSNQTPYGDPASTAIKAPPAGYELVFLENLGRHGARSLTSNDSEQRALAVWSGASQRGKLTSTGKRFDDDVRAFQRAEKSIGYGNLSAVGRAEWTGIGRRTADNYPEFWARTVRSQDDVVFKTTTVYRTQQSATALRTGLDDAVPRLDLKARSTSNDLLIEDGASRAGNAAIASTQRRSDVRAAATHLLRRLYTSSYVAGLSNPVGKALDIYGLYNTAPGMKGETNLTFGRYVPIEDAKLMAYAKDAQNFYRYGPGVAGEASSYKQARPVLDDFFTRLDTRLAGGTTAAVFRLAHGETTMPLAALMKAPGSQTQAPRTNPYSWGRNPWRGYVAGRLAGNIEWAAYRNAAGSVLVTMRYNEQPVKFRSSCRPSAADPYFYTLAQLKSCLR